MLIEFRVVNHRSIRDEQVLTMEAGRVGDAEDPRPRGEDGALRLLPAAALYGANASGKSNVLFALGFMRQAVVLSHRSWEPEAGVPRDPFAWGASLHQPSLFEVSLLLDGVRYQYGFVADDERFVEEWLFAWPKGRKQTWFEREIVKGSEKFKFGENLLGENRLVQEVTRPNALFLSAAAQLGHRQLAPIYAWFARSEIVRHQGWRPDFPVSPRLIRALRGARQMSIFEDDEPSRDNLDRLRRLLKSADFGIVDIRLVEDDSQRSTVSGRWRPRVIVRHRSNSEDAWLPLERESHGTRTLLRLGMPILSALQQGQLLVVDELEASLHPLLALQVLNQFNSPKTNPRNAQLLFTTHDTNLLGTASGEPALRRDQVWLTEKDNEGASILYPLTDYKPRKAENLERGYLQGRYGAIPFLNALVTDSEH